MYESFHIYRRDQLLGVVAGVVCVWVGGGRGGVCVGGGGGGGVWVGGGGGFLSFCDTAMYTSCILNFCQPHRSLHMVHSWKR